MLPRYVICVPFELELETASCAARRLGTVEGSWSQSRKCQLASSNAMHTSLGCSRRDHIFMSHAGPPAGRSTRQQATAASCVSWSPGCRRRRLAAPEKPSIRGGTRPVPPHIMRLDETGLSQKEESKFETALPSHGRRGLRSLGQPGEEPFFLLIIYLSFFLVFPLPLQEGKSTSPCASLPSSDPTTGVLDERVLQ